VHSLAPANAKIPASWDEKYKMVPVNTDGTISVKLPDEQLSKIIPKNEDGSINIRLSEKQLEAIAPQDIQDVNIRRVGGQHVDVTKTSRIGDIDYYSLSVHTKKEYSY